MAAKVAVTVLSASIVTWQAPVPLHASPQPPKVYPAPGAAVRLTLVWSRKSSLQSAPQSMPPGVELTVPSPDRVTLRRWVVGAGHASAGGVLTRHSAAPSPTPVPPPLPPEGT